MAGKPVDGVLYPRAGTLGGCTAHNAMILIYPHDADWDNIAELTGDQSWRADRMRSYFERLENCGHRNLYRLPAKLGFNPTRHGFNGWLSTEKAIPMLSPGNVDLLETIVCSAVEAIREIGDLPDRAQWAVEGMLDPNDWRTVCHNAFGIRYLPLTTQGHARVGTRERVLDVAAKHPDRLRVQLNALATRVLFDDSNRAIGVEYLSGERLYRAHPHPVQSSGELRQMFASREVILAGGVFNSPQLLMLSGIGPREELEAHGIPVRVDLPGVGRNLQDRYEISVVNRMNFDEWHIFKGARFDTTDPQFAAVEAMQRWSLHDQWGGAFHLQALNTAMCLAGPFLCGLSWPLRRLLSRLLGPASQRISTISPGPCSKRTPTTAPAASLFGRATHATRRRSTSHTSKKARRITMLIWMP